MPCVPPPGGVDDEHRYTFGIGVEYGAVEGNGRNRS
jgi:hypothetical protein